MTVRLEIINAMLKTIGVSKLSAEDTQHPDYIDADDTLTSVLQEFAAQELWFNTVIRTLAPDTSGNITVPANALTVDPIDTYINARIRGTRLWNINDRTYVFGSPVEVKIIQNVDLADMPPIVIQFVRAAARFEFFSDNNGEAGKLKRYMDKLTRMQIILNAANLSQMDLNFFDGAAAANFYVRRSATDRGWR